MSAPYPDVRPAWAHSCGWKSRCKLITANEVKRNCPAQRHAGEDHAILVARHALYLQSRALNPARWSGNTRNWSPIASVTLNLERDSVIRAHSACEDIQPMAA